MVQSCLNRQPLDYKPFLTTRPLRLNNHKELEFSVSSAFICFKVPADFQGRASGNCGRYKIGMPRMEVYATPVKMNVQKPSKRILTSSSRMSVTRGDIMTGNSTGSVSSAKRSSNHNTKGAM